MVSEFQNGIRNVSEKIQKRFVKGQGFSNSKILSNVLIKNEETDCFFSPLSKRRFKRLVQPCPVSLQTRKQSRNATSFTDLLKTVERGVPCRLEFQA